MNIHQYDILNPGYPGFFIFSKNRFLNKPIQFSPVIAGCMKWGTWGARFNTAQYRRMIEYCLEAGVTSFDHADIYGHYTTEEEFGHALSEMGRERSGMQLITKCGICMVSPNRPSFHIKHYDTTSRHIIASAEQSLHHLRTDYIDLFLIHRPDPLMNPEEIASAFRSLLESGKVLHVGVSNFSPSQVALLHALIPVEVNQVEISILHTDSFYNGILDQCIREKIIPQSWSPLGGGRIAAEEPDEKSRRIMAVAEILGSKYGASFDQILLAWLRQHPAGIIPILGTTRSDRIKDAQLSSSIKMSTEEWFMLLRAANGHEVP